jgi:Flp pilus assembly protein TadG
VTRTRIHPKAISLWTRRRLGARDESGITLILVAVLLVAILGTAALAIDLGNGYASSRQVQNASDDAALAGARVLQCYEITSNALSPLYNPSAASQFGCSSVVSPAQVAAKVAEVSQTDNGSSSATCEVISYYGYLATPPYYSVLDSDCSDTAGWQGNPLADGVYVISGGTKGTTFGRQFSASSITENRQSAATVQNLMSTSGTGIFLVCATGQTDTNNSGSVPSLVNAASTGLNTTQATIVDPVTKAYEFGPVYNSSLGGPIMELHGPQVSSCNTNGAFKGDGCFGNCSSITSGSIPGDFGYQTGVKAGPVRSEVAGLPGCTADEVANKGTPDCGLLLPVCTGPGGASKTLHCVAWGAFELFTVTANADYFGFLGAATVTGGGSAGGPASGSSAQVIQLVQ